LIRLLFFCVLGLCLAAEYNTYVVSLSRAR